MNVTSPVATIPTVHPVVQTMTQPLTQPTTQPTTQPMTQPMTQTMTQQITQPQPITQPMNPLGGQLIQMPNGQLFMLPSNSYPIAQPVTLQAVQPVGVNNEAFKKPLM